MKPIFRWTIGNTSKNGYECLHHAIKSILRLYDDVFDYYVLYNNANVQMLREIIGSKKINLIKQDWEYNPLPINYQENKESSIWKLIPPRLNINSHEIFSDNDLIITNKVKQIDEFLERENSVILVEDPVKFQGKFRHLFKQEKYNAGFFGLPPGYNMAEKIKAVWERNGAHPTINSSDEQGLTTVTLKEEKFINITKEEFVLVYSEGGVKNVSYNQEKNSNNIEHYPLNFFKDKSKAYHFVGINRKEKHDHWDKFKQQIKMKII